MDRQHLQDSAGEEVTRGERGADSNNMRRSDPQMRPPSATDNLRRTSTERGGRPSPDRRNLATTPDDMNIMTNNEDTFAFPTGRSYSWESHSDSEDRGGGNRSSSRTSMTRDQRKFDMTTPTLIDEDEEEEMISFQRSRQRQEERGFVGKDDTVHRRTPGASMYKSSFRDDQFHAASLRRTPGPLDTMHRSASAGGASSTVMSQDQVDESALLGFGLTLSSPVATGNRPGNDSRGGDTWEAQSTSSNPTPPRTYQPSSSEAGIVTHMHTHAHNRPPSRPPRAPGFGPPPQQQHHHHQQQQQQQHHPSQQPRGDFTFNTWTLPKAGQFQTRPGGAASPNTLRLTEDLGNLLFDAEEDSTDQTSQHVFRGAGQQQQSTDSGAASAESWTSSYVFKSEHVGDIPSRVPRSSMGRGRRGRNDSSSSRRSRGNDRPPGTTRASNDEQQQGQYQVASFLPYAQQPKPVRSMQMQASSSQNNPFLSGGFDPTSSAGTGGSSGAGAYPPADNAAQQQPRFVNFGGAFAPPAKDAAVGFRPPAPAPGGGQVPGNTGTLFMGQQTPAQHYQSEPSGQQPPAQHYQAGPSGQQPPAQHFQAGPSDQPPAQHFQAGPSGQLPAQHFQAGPSGQPPAQHFQAGSAILGDAGASSSDAFHRQSFQPLPPMAGPSRDSPYQHPFPSPNPGFGSAAVPPSPSFGYPRTSPYQSSGMQATAHEFVPTVASPPPPPHHPQRANQFPPPPRQQQFSPPPQPQPPPGWPGAPTSQYGSNVGQAAWPGSNTGWGGGDYGHGVHPAQQQVLDSRIGLSPAPPHVQSWPERGADYSSQPSPNIFGAAPPAHLDGPHHPVPVSASPVFASAAAAPPQSRRDQPQGQQSRQKPNRKGNARRSSKQGKPDRVKKSDSGGSPNLRRPTPVNSTERSSSTTGKKKKQSKGRDSKTPEASSTASVCSTPSNVPTPANVPGGDELSASEDPANLKKSELIESPATRSAFKDFYRRFRSEERASFQGAEDFAVLSLGDGSLPGKVHWRVYLELADLAKRSNRFADARRLYQQVCQLQPYASQGWLEYSKLEEECGHLNRGARILRAGLEYCEYSENLLTRAIKHEEKMGNVSRARELLARLKHVGIEKVWRTVLEGALLEARAGNVVMARRVLKYLMHHVPWYGPLYLEAYRLERDLGRTIEALEVVERGLAAIPRYGPLWFGAFRLCEEIDISGREYGLPGTLAMIDRATSSISKELIWKVHLDAAQMLERASLDLRAILEPGEDAESVHYQTTLTQCRNRFAMTILNCPPNLRWKVWLAAGRMEIAVGNTDRARRLFLRAHRVVPDKGRATTLLECARLEEFTGDFELASAILCKSRAEYGTDWKVWLESVLLEIRGGRHARAIELAKGALEIHPGTGRLWAALVQLRFFEGGEEAQFTSLKRALNAVPKSGEVWCEGGRIHLNPCSRTFNLERTRRHLFFATKFTPQYGDSFLESLRLELLEQWIAPMATLAWDASKRNFLNAENTDLQEALREYVFNIALELVSVCREDDQAQKDEAAAVHPKMLNESTVTSIRELLESTHRDTAVDLTDLELRCANADPNYGLLWFHCRHGPTDTARRILARASKKVATEVRRFVHVYIAAMVRHSAIMSMLSVEEGKDEDKAFPSIDDDAAWEDLVDERLLAAPSLYDILQNNGEENREKGVVFLENTIAGSTFATGLAELNKHQPIGDLSLNERRKALFGTDALFS